MYHQIMTTILWIHIHDVIHDVTKSQNRSNFEIDDQKLKMSEMPMAIFLVYSTSGVTSGKKVCRELKMSAILKFWNMKHSFNLTSDMKISSQIMPKKSIFMMMTSSMTSQGGLKVGRLYSFIYEITTFSW